MRMYLYLWKLAYVGRFKRLCLNVHSSCLALSMFAPFPESIIDSLRVVCRSFALQRAPMEGTMGPQAVIRKSIFAFAAIRCLPSQPLEQRYASTSACHSEATYEVFAPRTLAPKAAFHMQWP